MRAFRLLEAEQPPMLVDVPKPKAGSGQVVNKVGGIERIGLVSLRFPLAVTLVAIALALTAGFGGIRSETVL